MFAIKTEHRKHTEAEPDSVMRQFIAWTSVLFVLYSSVLADEDSVPAENLDISLFSGRVSACPAPYIVDTDNTCTCGPGWTRTNYGACAQCAAGSS